MKKLLSIIALSVSVLFVVPGKVVAADDLCPASFSNLCKFKAEGAGGIVGNIVNILFIVAFIMALFYLIYGGIKYIASEGDKSKIDAARHHLTAAIIGLMISLLGYLFINIVSFVFTGKNFTEVKFPKLLD